MTVGGRSPLPALLATQWWIVMMVGMLLFWGLVIAAIVWVVRELTHGRATRAGV